MSYYQFRDLVVKTDSIDSFIFKRLPPGAFFKAVLANDLAGAVSKADPTNLGLLPAYVAYCINHAPIECWGSYEKVNLWTIGGPALV